MRVLMLIYGILAYLLFLGSFLYAVGFVGNLVVPKAIDSGAAGLAWRAMLTDLALLSLFAVQHSGMARPAFKRWWTRIVPPPAERSTYVLLSSLALILLFWLWQPLPAIVWTASHPALQTLLWGLFAAGWGVVLVSTFLINHFDLFGLRQAYLYFSGRQYTPVPFRKRSLYRVVRHPIMLGFLIAFWATPTMTQGHLLFAVTVTAYVLVALQLEEHDLLHAHGEEYALYRRHVSMLLPLPFRRGAREDPDTAHSGSNHPTGPLR